MRVYLLAQRKLKILKTFLISLCISLNGQIEKQRHEDKYTQTEVDRFRNEDPNKVVSNRGLLLVHSISK